MLAEPFADVLADSMLTIHCAGTDAPRVWQAGSELPRAAAWYDLQNANEAETRAIEHLLDLPLPTREQIGGIGLAERNRSNGDTLFLHVSRFADAEDEHKHATPLALTLNRDVLVTQRFAASKTFDIAAQQWHATQPQDGSSGAFVELIETMTNRTADSMQKVSGDVAELSEDVFNDQGGHTRQLRRWLLHVGHLESGLARSRASLLGITRLATFMCDKQPEWMPDTQRARMTMVKNDLATLDEFDQQLTDKLQFLLDAIFGFVSINQNSVMKLFTVMTVVVTPPMILAAIWGMNFHAMPELAWRWGYVMALSAIAASILIPLAIFKWRGWLSSD